MKVFYIVDVWEHDSMDIEDASEFETNYDIHSAKGDGYDKLECEWLVDEICKYYFHNRDGWEIEQTWRDGIIVALWDENRNFVGKFSTILEYEPTFYVRLNP